MICRFAVQTGMIKIAVLTTCTFPDVEVITDLPAINLCFRSTVLVGVSTLLHPVLLPITEANATLVTLLRAKCGLMRGEIA